MNTAVGYAGDACSTYLLPRSPSGSFLGLDLILITANVLSGARLTSAVGRS